MKRDRVPDQNDIIHIALEPREFEVIESLGLEPTPAELGFVQTTADEVLVGLTWEEWTLLFAHLAGQASEADAPCRDDLDHVVGHICGVLGSYVPDLAAALRETLSDPGTELGADSEADLCSAPDGAEPLARMITVDPGLESSEVAATTFFHRTHTLLSRISAAGGVKATVANNLNRAFVREIARDFGVLTEWMDSGWAKHPMNEQDWDQIHIPRIVAEMARFLRRTKGVFYVTKKGKGMLAEEHAGELYAVLFHTFFNHFNLAYIDRRPDVLFPQNRVPALLAEIATRPAKWQRPLDVITFLLQPGFEELTNETELRYLGTTVDARVLRPLCDFGLMEIRSVTPPGTFREMREYRKTSLFDRFLSFPLG